MKTLVGTPDDPYRAFAVALRNLLYKRMGETRVG